MLYWVDARNRVAKGNLLAQFRGKLFWKYRHSRPERTQKWQRVGDSQCIALGVCFDMLRRSVFLSRSSLCLTRPNRHPYKASLISLPFHQGRKRAFNPHLVCIPKKYRGNERVHQIVQHLSAEFPLHEIGQTFFTWRWLRRAKDLGQNSQL